MVDASTAALVPGLRRAERDAIALHLAFGALAAGALLAPLAAPSGWRMASLVAAYLAAVPWVAARRGHAEWLDLYAFVVPLSVLQVLPDWFLASVLGVLVFPEDGFPKIGAVSGYMAGLWAIPLFVAVTVGRGVAARRGEPAGTIAAGLVALFVFAASEETLWAVPVWHAQGVRLVGHTALYVLLPEALLGALAHDAYGRARGRSLATKVALAAPVMLAYAGALAVSFLLVERVLPGD